jgi:hypothetical protein
MRYSVISILFIYSIFTLTTVALWHKQGINTVTGDEPHYLVMANGIGKYASFEQIRPYQEEFKTRKIYQYGLAAEHDKPSPSNTHAALGPHGLFNVHNVGLPLLLALPFKIGGVLGAKLFMIFCGALVILFSWKISGIFSENKKNRCLATMATCISLPLISASNQIYPELLGGLISLIGLYWFYTTRYRHTVLSEYVLASIVSFLPWLHLRFFGACFVLLSAVVVKIYSESKDHKRILRILSTTGISLALLAIYNQYAFGKIFGPYLPSALEFSKTSLMVLFGLFLDQNHGFLFQNPIYWVGVISIGAFYRYSRSLCLVVGLVFLSLIIPNALHITWYGGYSFSGRFEWAGAIVFYICTLFGLLRLAQTKEKLFLLLISCSLLLQIFFFYQYAIESAPLYNKLALTLLDHYSIFYFPFYAWFPALYNVAWAYQYLPNYIWIIFLGCVLTLGFLKSSWRSTVTPYTFFIFVVVIFISGFSSFSKQKVDEVVFHARDLPSNAGRLVGSLRIAEQGVDRAGFLTFGPYWYLRKGKYEIILSYSSASQNNHTVGEFDVFDTTFFQEIKRLTLSGTGDSIVELKINFKVNNWNAHLFEFRSYWNGSSNLKIHKIVLHRI